MSLTHSLVIPQSEENMNTQRRDLIKKICGIGVFAALAYITTFICKLIPNVAGFLSIDAKDAVIAIASFIYGPVAGPIIALIVAFVEFITISATGIWGFVMNFVSSATFSLVVSLIYKYRKTFNGAVIGFAVATVVTTAVMVALNPIIIPLYPYVDWSAADVVRIIPTVLLPFNFAKTLLNSALAMLLYKPIINAMRSARLVNRAEHKTEFNRTSLLTVIVGGVSLILALVILIIIW